MIVAVMMIGMVALLMLGVSVGVSIALAGVVGMLMYTTTSPLLIISQYFVSLDSFPLIAIPLFILAGNLMDVGGVSMRLINLSKAMVGHLPGGLAATCVVTCLIFGALTGSSAGTTFAIGAILIPAMVAQRYPVGFAAALQATSAELAVIIPPSITMIIYGVATNTSISELFIAGILPGLLIALVLVVTVIIWSMIKGYGTAEERAPMLPALKDATLALLLPIIILGGIYGGIFTPTEAAVVAVFYAVLLSTFVYRTLSLRSFYGILRKSTISTSFIMFTFAAAGFFSSLVEGSGVGQAMVAWVSENLTTPWMFLLVVNVLLLLVGIFIEPAPAIIVLGPLLAPIAVSLGIDPVHFGIVMTVNLAIGMITPPVGVNLFAACAVAKISMQKMIAPLMVMLAVVVATLMVITYVPFFTLGLLGR
ncbi:MAG: TRAP transporter large permease subunit [Mesorhizobium sp.]